MGAARADGWRLVAPGGAVAPAGAAATAATDAACKDPAAEVLARAEAAEAAAVAGSGGATGIAAPDDVARDTGAAVTRLTCGGREYAVRLRLERTAGGGITAVTCEVADGISGDLLQAAVVRPRIRLSSLAALDPWTRTAVRQTLRRLLAEAAGGDAGAVS